jgi:CheY-like chemotaxis protein
MANILVIDDESNLRLMVRLALQHVGHTVETAADGAEGLDRFGDGSGWDVVLLDHRMPGLTGLEVLKEMRARSPRARIIIITAFGTIDLATEAMTAGATDFLRKPFTAEILREAVQSALIEAAEVEGTFPSGVYDSAAINGFRLQPKADSEAAARGEVRKLFGVRGPRGEKRDCAVILPAHIVETVRSQATRSPLPGTDAIWQSLCEEALANYVWQHAEFPPDRLLRIDEITSSLLRRMDAALTGA